MRPPRPRFTVRRLMVAVAVVGIGLGVERALVLRADYRERANFHDRRVSMLAVIRDRGELPIGLLADRNIPEVDKARTVGRHAALVAHHEALRRKYEDAARHPWFPVEPDPPEPE